MSMPGCRGSVAGKNPPEAEWGIRKKTPECRHSGVERIPSAYFFFAVFLVVVFFAVLADPQPQPFFAGMKVPPFCWVLTKQG
jgi:hypothetical protein